MNPPSVVGAAELVAAVREDVRRVRGIVVARRQSIAREVASAEAAVADARQAVARPTPARPVFRRWRDLTDELASDAASAPWERWPTDPEPPGERSCLYRVGTVLADPPVPALVPLIDVGHLVVTGDDTAVADAVVAALLVRIVATTRPGSVRVSLFDPRRLGAGLGGFHALSRPGLLTVYGVDEFKDLLGSLDRDVRRIQRDVLGGGYSSLAELAAATGRRPEPWRVVIVQSPVRGFRDDELAHLNSVLHAGAACGIHVVCRDVPVEGAPDIERIEIGPNGVATTMTGPLEVRAEGPPAELVRAVCERAAYRIGVEREPPRFGDLVPARMWSESSASGIAAPVGEDTETFAPLEVFLGDDPVHALVGGPPGSGKTNFLYALIGSLAARYDPDELEFHLLDFKEGVSFARLAGGRTDKTWLPHARMVGVNINGDREFGLALLRHLGRELEERATAAREHEVTKLEELRAKDPGVRRPRIVAVIDEFQVLIGESDAITDEALHRLNDLARRGRSQGIHLVLASQNIGGVQALWGRAAILDQFTLRVALPKARRILADDNPAAVTVPRYCAVVNAESGARQANRVVRLPDAGAEGTFDMLQRELWQRRSGRLPPPRIFDGAHVPDLTACPDFQRLAPGEGPARAIVGQVIDLAGSAATVRFDHNPGRNLAVIGTDAEQARDVLAAAVLSLARGHRPGDAVFRLVPAEDEARPSVRRLAHRLADAGHTCSEGDRDDLPELLGAAVDRPAASAEYLVVFAVDAASGRNAGLRGPLRRLLDRGADNGAHLLGWWRTVDRLKADVVEHAGPVRTIDAWVALDARASELTPLPGGHVRSWTPRRGRALFHDQRAGSAPQPVIPFRVPTDRDAPGTADAPSGPSWRPEETR